MGSQLSSQHGCLFLGVSSASHEAAGFCVIHKIHLNGCNLKALPSFRNLFIARGEGGGRGGVRVCVSGRECEELLIKYLMRGSLWFRCVTQVRLAPTPVHT